MSKDRFVSTGSRIKGEGQRIKEIDTGLRIKGKTRGMKDSGVEWIGEIPEDWEVKKLGNISSLYIGNSIRDTDKDNYMHPEDAIPYIATKDVSLNNKINYKNGMYIKNNDRDFRRAYKGSSLICIEGGSAGKKIAQVMTECCFGNKLCCVDSQVILNNFLYYYLLSPSFNNSFNARITGLIPGVTLSELGEIEVVVPTKDNQRKIANFLDGKVSLIDDIIEKTKQSIEDYKKYKQALITETVTKGLNPDVEMKDSGIEWIGEIPKHWMVVKMKHTSSLKGRIGWQGLKSSEFIETGPYLITGTDFEDGEINWETCVHISEERYNEAPEIHIVENDLLITKDGTIGKVAIVRNCPQKTSLNSGVFLIRNTKNIKYENRYLYYVLLSDIFWRWFNSSLTGSSTIIHLYQEQFYNFSYAIPNIKEQQQIADYLDKKCSEIDKVITKKEKLIKDLEIYKKSLIYEYVTGKKRVV